MFCYNCGCKMIEKDDFNTFSLSSIYLECEECGSSAVMNYNNFTNKIVKVIWEENKNEFNIK